MGVSGGLVLVLGGGQKSPPGQAQGPHIPLSLRMNEDFRSFLKKLPRVSCLDRLLPSQHSFTDLACNALIIGRDILNGWLLT